MKRLNNNWEFTDHWNESFLNYEGCFETIRIPHNVKELPLHYIDPDAYAMISGYRKKIYIPNEYLNKHVILQFDGAAHIATLYVNRKKVLTHFNGYTGFSADITDYVQFGKENEICVELDSTENAMIPPFGFVIDYLTYGGIYRDVWMDYRNPVYIKDLFVSGSQTGLTEIEYSLNGTFDGDVEISIYDQEGQNICTKTVRPSELRTNLNIYKPHLWEPLNSYLYKCEIKLLNNNICLDSKITTFGYRTISLNENRILINGKEVFIRGLNRHQSFPYIGYAATEHLQREDVRILEEELGVNAVRTSHYPQSHYFLDECDRRGILVFTEIPGWQFVSKEEFWRNQCLDNVREMVTEYRNHPSIYMWGVRINESTDDDELYVKTNEIAHSLDHTRPTSGVRYIEKSHLLEDVYAFNDFSHNGKTPGAKAKKNVTKDLKKPLIISEANGHMFPTKSYDNWEKRQEHALRHARVLNSAIADGQHAGCYQWCMFDYPTHQDFGSGDRICYHGVMDSFRNPKLAASVYASQSEAVPVLEVGSSMDIGDYPGGQITSIYCFTNGDEIKLYKNNQFVKSFYPEEFTAMNHGPILIDDLIGELVIQNEEMPERQAKLITECLNSMAEHGLANLPVSTSAKLAYIMTRYHMSFKDGYDLYGKYVGNWGGKATEWKFEALRNGVVISSVIKTPGKKLHLHSDVSQLELTEGDVYDMAAVRIKVLDENNNPAVYAQLPVILETEGSVELIGPRCIVLEGGMCGTYVRTNGTEGKGKLTIKCTDLETITIEFNTKGEIE